MTLSFLLEIGVEEMPDWMIEPAIENLHLLFSQALRENRLGGEVLCVDGTPRRLALRADGLRDRQPDEVKRALGPPLSAGPGAAQGFAKKMGVTVADLETSSSAKGEYYAYNKQIEGRATLEILSTIVPGLVEKIYFPKTMYWTGKDGLRFIRPIRWVVALLGEKIVPFEIAGVRSGNVTRGHRQLGASEIPVGVSNYEDELRKNYVILSAAQRRARIEEGLGRGVRKDEALLNTLVYLTEFPTPIRGSFDVQYLELPGEILTTVMRHHQRYFSVEDGKGGLAPEFVAVMNTSSDPEGLVRKGNERVLRARFNDARFFWEVDLRRRLEERVEDLEKVTFQAKLGSYREKTARVSALSKELARKAGVNSGVAERSALLSKCDLTTDMVKEFPELQGVVGGLY
ncbi:MAG: glycine--tRNA ligase subunit beta, partial [Bryobacteraceae bacterium]